MASLRSSSPSAPGHITAACSSAAALRCFERTPFQYAMHQSVYSHQATTVRKWLCSGAVQLQVKWLQSRSDRD